MLRWFVDAGAPEEILWQAKPHIGTDLLVDVVRRMRGQIIAAGGEVRFNTQLAGLRFEAGALAEAEARDVRTGRTERIPARRVVLACGHSARDTFELVHGAGLVLEQKPFSVGVRIEHLQRAVDEAQYGAAAAHPALGAADYKLAVHLPAQGGEGRGVYTFCMCPGGQVVCAASEAGGVVVNGMSRFARDGENANSALLVGVGPEDFGSDHPLAGVELQRRMERAAYEAAVAAGGAPYAAPAQTVGDFLAGRAGGPSAAVRPTYARGVAWCDLRDCLPPFAADALARALPLLDAKLHGFADEGAVMTGVETRSSSPVRIVRNEGLQAVMSGATAGGRRRRQRSLPLRRGRGLRRRHHERRLATASAWPGGGGRGRRTKARTRCRAARCTPSRSSASPRASPSRDRRGMHVSLAPRPVMTSSTPSGRSRDGSSEGVRLEVAEMSATFASSRITTS